MKKQAKTTRTRTKRSNFPRDLTGKRFGKWVVLESVGKWLWLCRCDCGVQKNVRESSLMSKRSTQCLRCSWAKRSMGHTKSYFAWQRLKQNGSLPKQWQEYEVFLDVVGDPPSDDARLARHDIYKPHSRGNTYWVSFKESLNRRQMREDLKDQAIIGDKILMTIRKAKTRVEMIRRMVAARKAGYSYEMIGRAAGLSRQRAHIIVTKHLE